eukprot:31531-Pelagococcus_subviridis.AAC.4
MTVVAERCEMRGWLGFSRCRLSRDGVGAEGDATRRARPEPSLAEARALARTRTKLGRDRDGTRAAWSARWRRLADSAFRDYTARTSTAARVRGSSRCEARSRPRTPAVRTRRSRDATTTRCALFNTNEIQTNTRTVNSSPPTRASVASRLLHLPRGLVRGPLRLFALFRLLRRLAEPDVVLVRHRELRDGLPERVVKVQHVREDHHPRLRLDERPDGGAEERERRGGLRERRRDEEDDVPDVLLSPRLDERQEDVPRDALRLELERLGLVRARELSARGRELRGALLRLLLRFRLLRRGLLSGRRAAQDASHLQVLQPLVRQLARAPARDVHAREERHLEDPREQGHRHREQGEIVRAGAGQRPGEPLELSNLVHAPAREEKLSRRRALGAEDRFQRLHGEEVHDDGRDERVEDGVVADDPERVQGVDRERHSSRELARHGRGEVVREAVLFLGAGDVQGVASDEHALRETVPESDVPRRELVQELQDVRRVEDHVHDEHRLVRVRERREPARFLVELLEPALERERLVERPEEERDLERHDEHRHEHHLGASVSLPPREKTDGRALRRTSRRTRMMRSN